MERADERQREDLGRRDPRPGLRVSINPPRLNPTLLTHPSASCATIVRLRYLALYSDPGEFMYGTGKIGFWSLMEEGIGIVAGSLHALRPLLSLRLGVSSSCNTPAAAEGRSEPLSGSNKHGRSRSRVVMMDTFQTLGDGEEGEHDDADSQKNIVKETKYSVTSSKVAISEEERLKGQVLGWEQALKT
jgi:hypothetical protein